MGPPSFETPPEIDDIKQCPTTDDDDDDDDNNNNCKDAEALVSRRKCNKQEGCSWMKKRGWEEWKCDQSLSKRRCKKKPTKSKCKKAGCIWKIGETKNKCVARWD